MQQVMKSENSLTGLGVFPWLQLGNRKAFFKKFAFTPDKRVENLNFAIQTLAVLVTEVAARMAIACSVLLPTRLIANKSRRES